MKILWKWTAVLTAAVLLLSITACGKKQVEEQQSPPGTAVDSSWEEIIARGSLNVCLAADGVVCNPLSSTDPSDFSTALITQIADRLGITPEFTLCAQEEVTEKIKEKAADLTFGVRNEALGCSQTVLETDGQEYCLMYRKEDGEFAHLLSLILQSMANDGLLSQLSIDYFEQDYSVIPSQVDTGQPTEEEAEEYNNRIKENN